MVEQITFRSALLHLLLVLNGVQGFKLRLPEALFELIQDIRLELGGHAGRLRDKLVFWFVGLLELLDDRTDFLTVVFHVLLVCVWTEVQLCDFFILFSLSHTNPL